LEISTPGRICLFGEHQDYLGLPVIAMAISLRTTLKGEKRQDRKVVINKPDLSDKDSFSLDDLTYTKQRDYFKSGIKICKREGLTFSAGFDCEIASQIPIKAGCGSSSAVLVNWIHFLSQMADEPPDWSQQKIGELAYAAEVLEFNEPGGMMDQYTTAMGQLIYLESYPEIKIRSINSNLGTFVLGDSCEPKDTMGILGRCRDARLAIIKKLKIKNPNARVQSYDKNIDLSDLDEDELLLFHGTIKNRDLLKNALTELEKEDVDDQLIGKMLTEHHQVLRDVLQVSTPKIESMLKAALNAGALGGKINGSGGGGCMFVYAPENPENVVEAVKSAGGDAFIIKSDEGTKID
jgi:galactokinase